MRILIKEPGKDPHTMVVPNNDIGVLQQLIDGYVEMVRITDGLVMLVDEDGLLKKKERNFHIASLDDDIVGTAIFCGEDEDKFTDIGEGDLVILQTFFSIEPTLFGGAK